jgi:hypothetical protein
MNAPRLVIVPNALHDAINKRLDAAIAECPDAAIDREALYAQLVAYFDEHGCIPDFRVERKP